MTRERASLLARIAEAALIALTLGTGSFAWHTHAELAATRAQLTSIETEQRRLYDTVRGLELFIRDYFAAHERKGDQP